VHAFGALYLYTIDGCESLFQNLCLHFLVLKELVKWGAYTNQCNNRSHPSSLILQDRGVTHMDITSRAGIAMIQVIHQQNQQVSLVEAATATTAFSHQISDQTEKGNGDAIFAPPADILGASTQPRSMQLFRNISTCKHQRLQIPASSNLQMPASSKKRKRKMRCLRCGGEKLGSHHKLNAPTTSAEYFAVPSLYLTSHWLVPDGYEIGDTRKKTRNSSIKYKWKRRKKELGLPFDESNFPG
jgi:hypothetical protein